MSLFRIIALCAFLAMIVLACIVLFASSTTNFKDLLGGACLAGGIGGTLLAIEPFAVRTVR